jgi:hypothetical protein
VEGIPTEKLVGWSSDDLYDPRTPEYVLSRTCRVNMYIDGNEPALVNERGMGVDVTLSKRNTLYEDETFALKFSISGPFVNTQDTTFCTISGGIVCPYIFGDDEAHTLEVEVRRVPGDYDFLAVRFDGAEPPPIYSKEGWPEQYSYIVQVDR